jgi:hypothetical protein
MPSQSSLTQVQNAYIAYYGRPADPEGQLYWANQLDSANGNLSAIINQFGTSTEYTQMAQGKSYSTLINQLYTNMFNRSADQTGLDFYVNLLLSGKKTLASIALDVLNGASGTDTTTLAAKYQAASAFTTALATPAQRDSYNSDTINSAKNWLHGIADSQTAVVAISTLTTSLPTILQAGTVINGNAMVYNLTTSTDNLAKGATANIFNSMPDYTPAGNYRENTLQDEDVLTGIGSTATTPTTLNATLSNNSGVTAAAGSTTITPTLNGIELVNVAFTGSGLTAVNDLNLQDSSGYKTINITRISDGVSINPNGDGVINAGDKAATIDSMRFVPTNLSVTNTGQDNPHVSFLFTNSGVSGANDSTALTLNNANIGRLTIEENTADGVLDQGIETISLKSTGSSNSIQTMAAQDLKTLVITGDQALSISGRYNVTGAQGIEATDYTAGLDHVAGSLTRVDASAFTGNLAYTIGKEINGGLTGTSGTNVSLTVMGGSGDDTFRLASGQSVDANDIIDGGAGNNTLVMFGGTSAINAATTANVKNIQNLEVRTGHDADALADTVTIDANAFNALANIYVRNEGQTVAGTAGTSAAEGMTVSLNNLGSAQANAVTLAHGTTGNSSIGNNILSVNLANAGGAADTAKVTLVDGINADPVFNANIAATGVELFTLVDNDSESNTIQLNTSGAFQAGSKLTVQGGVAGTYINFDTLTTKTLAAANSVAGATSGYGYSTTGAAGNATTALATANRDTVVSSVFRDNGIAASNQINVETIDASADASNVIVRVGELLRADGVSSQSITTGAGDDSIIFDALNNATAGYSSGDTVHAGAGNDTLIIDGNNVARIALQKSEWDNTTGIDNLRLAGNAGVANVGNGAIVTDTRGAYYVEIDNNFVKQTDAGNNLTIINNDGDLTTNSESDMVLNLRGLDQTSNVNFIGANGVTGGVGISSNRILLDDVSANGSNKLDGGDTDVSTVTNTGNNNVLEIFDTAQVSINDLANTKNFGRIEFTNDLSTAQTLTLSLNNTVMDQMIDSNHLAANTVGNTERLVVVAQNNSNLVGAVANLNIDASTVSNAFGLDVLLGRGTNNTIVGTAGTDKVVMLGNFTAAEQTADGYAAINLFTASSEAANALNGANLAANGVAYKGADGVAGTADDALLAYTGTYTLGAGDTIETFGGVDLSGVTSITAGTNIVSHSAIKLTQAQLNSLGTITFVGNEAHGLTVVNTAGSSLDLSKVIFSGSGASTALNVATTATPTSTIAPTLEHTGGYQVVVNGTAVVGAATPTLTASAASVDEGSSVNLTLSNATAGTYNIAIAGTNITPADYSAPTTVTVGSSGTATFTINAQADATTEGPETMNVTATLVGATTGLTKSVVINDTSLTGSTATSTTATVNIAAAGASTDGGSTVNTTYNIAAGAYTYTITGFGAGDKFVPFAGAAVSVVPDSNDTDGTQSIQFADAVSGTTTTITLVGLTGAQDAGLFNQGSINTVFGAGTI